MKKLTTLAAIAALALTTTACGVPTNQPSAGSVERRTVAANQQKLLNAVALPNLPYSQERVNLVKRLERINAQNMTGCVYLISQGSVIAFYPVRGKVSSLNSYLTGPEQIVNDPNGTMDAGSLLMEQPDLDGAYGENAKGVFFFTADTDTYVEWKGEYLFSDACLALNQQAKLVRTIPAK